MNNQIQKILLYPFLIFSIVLPLIFNKELFSVFTMPKLLVLRIFSAIILIIIAVYLFKKREIELFKSRINFYLILYGIWLILSTLFSTAFFVSLFGVDGRYTGLISLLNFWAIYFLSLNFFNNENYAKNFLAALVIGGSLSGLYGIFQFCYATFTANALIYQPFYNGEIPYFLYLSGEKFADISLKTKGAEISAAKLSLILFYFLLAVMAAILILFIFSFEKKIEKIIAGFLGATVIYSIIYLAKQSILLSWTQAPEFRVFSTIGHANHFGSFIVVCLFAAIALIFLIKKKIWRFILAFLIIIFSLILVVTASRGSFLGLLVGTLGTMPIILYEQKIFIKKHLKKIFLIVLGSIFISGTFIYFAFSKLTYLPIIYRTKETIDFMLQGNLPDRISWYLSSLEMIKDYPIFGIGIDTYRNNYNSYRRLDYKMPTGAQYETTPESSHFEFLNIAVTQGTIGLIFYLLLVCFALKTMIKAIISSKNPALRIIILSLYAASISYLGQTLISFGTITSLSIFILTLGIGTGLSFRELQQEKLVWIRNKISTGIIFLIIAIILLTSGGSQYLAHYYYSKGIAAEKNGKGDKAILNYSTSIEYLTAYYPAYEKMADLYLLSVKNLINIPEISAYLNKAEENYQKAIYYAPKMPHLYGNLAQVYSKMAIAAKFEGKDEKLSTDLFNKAKEAALSAIKYGINNPIFPYYYGQILETHEKSQEAVKQFLRTYEIDTNFLDTELRLAENYFAIADYINSRKYLNLALSKNPKNLEFTELDTRLKGKGY